jgi:hypothetical protein
MVAAVTHVMAVPDDSAGDAAHDRAGRPGDDGAGSGADGGSGHGPGGGVGRGQANARRSCKHQDDLVHWRGFLFEVRNRS